MATKLKFVGMILENNLPSQLCVTDAVDYFHPWSCGPPIILWLTGINYCSLLQKFCYPRHISVGKILFQLPLQGIKAQHLVFIREYVTVAEVMYVS